jgi:hypothetical protein
MPTFREFVAGNNELDQTATMARAAIQSGAVKPPAAAPGPPGEEHDQPVLPIMNVGSGKIDARIGSIGYEKAYMNMLRAVDQILSDESAMVQTIGEDAKKYGKDSPAEGSSMPWGQLYFNDTGNSPRRNYIEIEYAPQATKGFVGDLGFAAGWFANRPFSGPFRWAAEKLGWAKNPEKFYLAQFIKEMRRLANQKILFGLDEWDINTSFLGRNIIIKPKVK